MYTLKEAVAEFRDDLEYDIEHSKDKNDVFEHLWYDYYDKNPEEEMAVFNVIIAKMALEEGEAKSYVQKKHIVRVMSDYERLKDKIYNYYKDEIDLLNDLEKEINSKKHIWNTLKLSDMFEIVKCGYEIEKRYARIKQYNDDKTFSFTQLFRIYDYENPDFAEKIADSIEEKIVFSIIIAKLALEEEENIPISEKVSIRKAMADYEKHKDEIEAFCKDDLASFNSLVEEVNSQKHIWNSVS